MKTLLFPLLLLLYSCGSGKTEPTAPVAENYENRKELLEEKKNRLAKGTDTILPVDQTISDIAVSFTPFVPAYPDLGEDGADLIRNKLQTIISRYGVSGAAADPGFALIPAINIVSKEITSGAPSMIIASYELTLFTTNLSDGTIFSSRTFSIIGTGASPLRAFINALASANLQGPEMGALLREGATKGLAYYNTNCERIINAAKSEAAIKNYESSFVMLRSIPTQTNCRKQAESLIREVFNKKMATDCNALLSQFRSVLGNRPEIGGYNPEAMAIYGLIPRDAPCFTAADQIYNSYLKNLNPEAKQKWEQEEREYALRKDKQDKDHEFAMAKTEMEAKVAIEGQTALLNKYKKDHEYNKLPWLRKLVHLGEWDPFDPTSRINK